MASRMPPQAQRLLDAHVTYLTSRLEGEALRELLETEIDRLLADAGRITLNEAVSRELIKTTVRSYAVELELSGAIPELVGDIARTLYAHPIHRRTTLNDLLPDGLFTEFLDKILDMHELHHWIVHEAVTNPVYAALAAEVVMEGIRGYLREGGSRLRRMPGAGLLRNALPFLEEGLEEGLQRYIEKRLQGLLQRSEHFLLDLIDAEQVRTLALEAWDLIKDKRIADFQEGVSSLDIEEFFVIGYELWRALRTTPFYGALIDSGIEAFFDKYGESSLQKLLEEMGITREIILRDALRFAPPVLAMLQRKGLLEPLLRRHLAGFYASPAVAAILAAPAPETAPRRRKTAPAAPVTGSAATPPRPRKSTAGPRAAPPADTVPPAKRPAPRKPAKPAS